MDKMLKELKSVERPGDRSVAKCELCRATVGLVSVGCKISITLMDNRTYDPSFAFGGSRSLFRVWSSEKPFTTQT